MYIFTTGNNYKQIHHLQYLAYSVELKPYQLPGWMKTSSYPRPSATAGIRTSDLPHSMTMSKESHALIHEGIDGLTSSSISPVICLLVETYLRTPFVNSSIFSSLMFCYVLSIRPAFVLHIMITTVYSRIKDAYRTIIIDYNITIIVT